MKNYDKMQLNKERGKNKKKCIEKSENVCVKSGLVSNFQTLRMRIEFCASYATCSQCSY